MFIANTLYKSHENPFRIFMHVILEYFLHGQLHKNIENVFRVNNLLYLLVVYLF